MKDKYIVTYKIIISIKIFGGKKKDVKKKHPAFKKI